MFDSRMGECACGREGRLFQGRCFACWSRLWPSEESGDNNGNDSAGGATTAAMRRET